MYGYVSYYNVSFCGFAALRKETVALKVGRAPRGGEHGCRGTSMRVARQPAVQLLDVSSLPDAPRPLMPPLPFDATPHHTASCQRQSLLLFHCCAFRASPVLRLVKIKPDNRLRKVAWGVNPAAHDYIALHCIASQCITSHRITSHHIASHRITSLEARSSTGGGRLPAPRTPRADDPRCGARFHWPLQASNGSRRHSCAGAEQAMICPPVERRGC
jgi:hypothetical protein